MTSPKSMTVIHSQIFITRRAVLDQQYGQVELIPDEVDELHQFIDLWGSFRLQAHRE